MNNEKFDSQEFQFVYQHLSDDIERTKRRQWSIPYYILLLFAAIVGFLEVYAPCGNNSIPYTAIYVLAFIIGITGTYHVIDVHFVQLRARREINRFIQPHRDSIHPVLIPDMKNLAATYYLFSLTFFFVAIIVLALIFVLVYLHAGRMCIIYLPLFCLYWAIGVYLYKEHKLETKLPHP